VEFSFYYELIFDVDVLIEMTLESQNPWCKKMIPYRLIIPNLDGITKESNETTDKNRWSRFLT